MGERTDIHIDAVAPGTPDLLTAIIEVKGCWHRELRVAMQTQLRDRYLRDNRCRHGLYLVGWYLCPQWDQTDLSRRRPPFTGLADLRAFLEAQAAQISSADVILRACMLNAVLR